MKKLLYDTSKMIGIELSEIQLKQFQLYFDLLIETNKVMNLTAITEMEEVVLKHFVDSIALAQYISLSEKKIIDVGTGAGFPGIPLAILCSDAQFMLMDSLNKRIRFLDEVIKICELENVETIHSRAEDLGRNKDFREQYDLCVSRAVANMSTLLEYCIPFIKVGGRFISYKSGDMKEELKKSETAQRKLNCKRKEVIPFELPRSDMQRTFVIFEKEKALLNKYPRQSGKPKREPL